MYPCGECAAHFKELVGSHPPQVATRADFSLWMCEVCWWGRRCRAAALPAAAAAAWPAALPAAPTLPPSLSPFFQAHNIVNRRLGKPTFNCSLVQSRWAGLECGEDGADACSLDFGRRR